MVGPATTSIRCAPTSESTAPSTTAPLVVSPFSPMKGAVQTPMNAGADARVQLTSTTAFDASYTFAVEGAQLRSPPTRTSPTERVLALRVAPDSERVVVHIVRNGLSLQSLTFAVRADSAPPTLQQLEVTRPTDDAVLVRVDVVDDKSGVGPVNAEWLAGALGTALVATTPLLKQADGHYQALVGTDVIRGASAVRVVATDLAGNGPAMAQVPLPLQGDPSILWLVIPPALAAPLVLGGSALIVDGTFFDQTVGPLVGEPLGQALGLERQASADIERASGAALVVTGIAITAAGVVTYLVLQPSFASGANE